MTNVLNIVNALPQRLVNIRCTSAVMRIDLTLCLVLDVSTVNVLSVDERSGCNATVKFFAISVRNWKCEEVLASRRSRVKESGEIRVVERALRHQQQVHMQAALPEVGNTTL